MTYGELRRTFPIVPKTAMGIYIMKNHARICLRQTVLILIAYMLAGMECLSADDIGGIDKASVRNIEVRLDDDNLDQFGISLPKSSIIAQIVKNLAGANFPVHKSAEKAFSHTLNAHLSRIEHQDTPSGFSFTMGNSDSRAEDFQKADVITVECALIVNKNPQETAKQTMEFSANSLKKLKDVNKIAATLADHVSAACYNLLEDLALDESGAPAAEGRSIKKPRWMPDIRIEVINEEPTPAKNNAGANVEKPANTEEPHKKMIIHNEGTPVILKFGYERM